MAGGEEPSAGEPPFLPPEPGGPEPELDPAPAQGSEAASTQGSTGWEPPSHAQPQTQAPQPPQGQGAASSPYAQASQPPAGYGPASTQGWGPPPSQGWGQPPSQGWGPPPPGWHPPPAQPQPQPWVYSPQPREPDNGPAVAGFTLSLVAAGLLLISAGTSSIVSVVCAALGILYSRKGRKRVDAGETPKHRGLAQAGFITGIVTLALAVLATIFWVVIVVLYATNEEFRRDLESNPGGGGFETTARAAALIGRVTWSLIC